MSVNIKIRNSLLQSSVEVDLTSPNNNEKLPQLILNEKRNPSLKENLATYT